MYELGIAYNYTEKLDLGLSYNNRRGAVFDEDNNNLNSDDVDNYLEHLKLDESKDSYLQGDNFPVGDSFNKELQNINFKPQVEIKENKTLVCDMMLSDSYVII